MGGFAKGDNLISHELALVIKDREAAVCITGDCDSLQRSVLCSLVHVQDRSCLHPQHRKSDASQTFNK